MGGIRATVRIRSKMTIIEPGWANLFEKSRLEVKRFYER